MKSFVVPLLLTAGLVLAAPVAPADADAPIASGPADVASWWTPPPEPDLVPVPATSCPASGTTKRATCLSDALPVSDSEALAAARADAGARAGQVSPLASSGSSSLTPSDLTSLYRIPAVSTSATVGIVDVGSDPNTAAQMSYFRRTFGLPPCTTANGCFREVAQDGSGALPPVNSDWTAEIAMDVQAVSAVCPACNILLVDADSPSSGDMGQAVLTATRLGATYLSLSYGSTATAGDRTMGSTYYGDSNVTYVAASGDSGYDGGTLFPASAPNVVAAGGTSARRNGSSWQQTAWQYSGSGCSPASTVPSWQDETPNAGTACSGRRAVSDLSALADPNTGLMFYRAGSWWSGGGTSLAAPIITSLYALVGNHTAPMSVYQNSTTGGLVDIASGSTGSCSPAVLCNAGPGWDGPTGLGTPSGLAGLAATGSAQSVSYTDQTSATLTASGSYPTRLRYHLDDDTTGLPLGGAAVVVEASTGGPFQVVDAGITGRDGGFTAREHPKAPTVYRVVYTGDSEHSPVTSPSAATDAFVPRVKVKRTHRRGATMLRAAVRAPWGAALRAWPLRLQHQKHGRWHTGKVVHTNRTGTASVWVRHTGRYRIGYGGAGWRVGHTAAVRLR